MLLKKIIVFVIFFTMSGTSIAQAEPYLNNGHISFNDPSDRTQNFLEGGHLGCNLSLQNPI
jgi:hypothetical protein